MNTPKLSPTIAGIARAGQLVERAVNLAGAGLRAAAHGLWILAGSRQLYHVLILTGVMALVVGAKSAYDAQATLMEIARAQQITSYAVMRQMQAAGVAPTGDARSAPTPTDPAQLEAPKPAGRGAFLGPVEH